MALFQSSEGCPFFTKKEDKLSSKGCPVVLSKDTCPNLVHLEKCPHFKNIGNCPYLKKVCPFLRKGGACGLFTKVKEDSVIVKPY